MNKVLGALSVGGLMLTSAIVARTDFRSAFASPDPTRFQMAQAEPAAPDAAPPPGVSFGGPPASVAPPPMPQNPLMQDPQAMARIDAQIDALMQAPKGGFAVTYYAKPAPPPSPLPPGAPGQQAGGAPPPPSAVPPPGTIERDRSGRPLKYVVARAGDSTYATLDRAFDSDDPQGPVFATIHDVDNSGIEGPLDGVRLVGKLTYSSSQGAIEFKSAYLPDGRPLELKALAVSEDTARNGIAKNVDQHLLQRYGSLVFASVVQGAGQVGQILLQNNQQSTIDPTTGFATVAQKVTPYQAILAGSLPVGQALTAAAAQNFNQPATITAPAGTGIGIVFLDPVVLPRDVLFAHAARR